MGCRANFVIVDPDGWRLYYAHYGGQYVDIMLAAGPAAALRSIEADEPVDRESGWLDDRWAEGGALVDPGRKVLVFYGGEEMGALNVRRAYFAILRRTWPGWRVGWAFDGLGDVVRYVGVDVAVVRVPELQARTPGPLEPWTSAMRGYRFWGLITARTDAGVTAWPVRRQRPHPASAGAPLLDTLDALGPGVRTLEEEPPEQGLHLDVPARTVSWWSTDAEEGLSAVLPERWPGWTVEGWGDDYERHRALVDGVRTPGIDVVAGLDVLEELYGRSWDDTVRSAVTAAHAAVTPVQEDARRLAAALVDVRRAGTVG